MMLLAGPLRTSLGALETPGARDERGYLFRKRQCIKDLVSRLSTLALWTTQGRERCGGLMPRVTTDGRHRTARGRLVVTLGASTSFLKSGARLVP